MRKILFPILTGLLLASCAGSNDAILSTHPPIPAGTTAIPNLVPPPCKGQKTTKNYATVTGALSTQGGSFCIPAFGGLGGNVQYPAANPSVQLTLTTSTSNYNHQPQLGKGTPLVYLQLALSGATTFASGTKSGGGLTGKAIAPGKSYTAYGQATILGFPVNFGPCYTVAVAGKYGGVIGGIGSLLKSAHIPAAATGVVEIYPGKQTTTGC